MLLMFYPLQGCVPAEPAASEDGHRSGEIVLWPSASVDELEPNNDFERAMNADVTDSILIAGRLTSAEDADVYALGPAAQATSVRCTLQSADAGEMSVCLFDEQERLLARSAITGPEQPRSFVLLLPEPVKNLYLLASLVDGSTSQGYSATVTVQSEPATLTYRPQVVLLNFDGAEEVSIAGRLYERIPPFDAASIDHRYAGQTGDIIQLLLAEVREDFLGVDVLIYLASDPLVPPGPYSTIHFGSANPDLLGVADGVDPFNSQPSESAIVYTDTFSLFGSLQPDAGAMAQVLANVTSHELGHLLGLRHTNDHDDIMDITATARRLMSDQWFKKARLHASVCPLGYQDSPSMLSWAMGGELQVPSSTRSRIVVVDPNAPDFEIPRSLLCGHCALEPR